tara:strand:- start:207 stop:2147 length:1941 start_codon:yes stop_codon:yes gene_type:complete
MNETKAQTATAKTLPVITPIKDGPLRVQGLETFEGADGPIDAQPEMALCRCGLSASKPFCDGAHVAGGFKDEKQADREPDRRDTFEGDPVTIFENVAICSHAGYCPNGAPDKWRPKTDTGGHTDDELIPMIRKCPSGALSYATEGKEHRDQERDPAVSITKNGPYCIEGGIELTKADWAEGASQEHYALCRCGGSKNKPFCDGAHDTVWAKGEDTLVPDSVPATEASGPRPTPAEPHVAFIHELARNGLTKLGPEGPMGAMGVLQSELPTWDKIQIMAAQLDPAPLQGDVAVGTDLVIGPKAAKPLRLKIPLFVSDMSFGALSEEVKVALSKGSELAGTGICSGEGGVLPEEQQANSRYLYEFASGKFGYREELLKVVQAMHFKCGQGAKTGTGGHLPGDKVVGKIAEVRGLVPGTPSESPPTFTDMSSPDDFRRFADRVREVSGGIPIGFKISANRLERTIDFALKASADYIILDGRGGGTGAAPLIFRDNISVPTIPALARARHHLDRRGVSGDVTLIITGGLRVPADYIKAMALGADGIALSNAAIQAVGCIGARICNTNKCPAGIATQDPELRALVNVEEASQRVARFFGAAVQLMQVMARACGHDHLGKFRLDDIATWHREMADLTGIDYSGFQSDRELQD